MQMPGLEIDVFTYITPNPNSIFFPSGLILSSVEGMSPIISGG
jgi:hypothetical protein